MKVEYCVSKNYVADLCRMSQVNGCKGRQVFQTCTRIFVVDWFLMVRTDWEA
ncbi:unknown [Bacteroides sp. CAG:770]|nr:unknown [Bacteroides sp. CAG:770]